MFFGDFFIFGPSKRPFGDYFFIFSREQIQGKPTKLDGRGTKLVGSDTEAGDLRKRCGRDAGSVVLGSWRFGV